MMTNSLLYRFTALMTTLLPSSIRDPRNKLSSFSDCQQMDQTDNVGKQTSPGSLHSALSLDASQARE
jgi:hypothetical protein